MRSPSTELQLGLLEERKVCLGCTKSLPLDDFAPIKSSPGRRCPRCRGCMKEYFRAWQAQHPGYAADKAKTRRDWLRRTAGRWNEAQERKAYTRPPSLEADRVALLAEFRQQHPRQSAHADSVADGVPKIYFVQEGERGAIKIGYTLSTIGKRIHQLQNGNPRPLYVRGLMLGDEAIEKLLHQLFGHLRMPGTQEWFEPGEELLAFVQEMTITPRVRRRTRRAG